MNPIVQMENIAKHFGGTKALKSVDLNIYPSEIHALLGENGAGKSTLMKILSGIYTPTQGLIRIDQQTFQMIDHHMAKKLGISIIYQELSLIDELTVLENLYIGRLPVKKRLGINIVDWALMRAKATKILTQLCVTIDLDEKVENLSISYKQMVEIAKSLMLNNRILIMDEPTSSLTNKEIDALFVTIERLRQDGISIIYISHKLNEIQRICNRYTVLKDGETVATGLMNDVSNEDLIKMMVGRALNDRFLNIKMNKNHSNNILFEVKNLNGTKIKKVHDINFSIKQGEILGFAGLVGSGRTELMDCIFGIEPIKSGCITLRDREITPRSPLDAIKKGMAYLTESRRENGFFDNFSIVQNMSIVKDLKQGGRYGFSGLIHSTNDKQLAEEQKKLLSIKCRDIEQNITKLSGGNQQKVLISKWILSQPDVFIFDEPTRGIDVGAKSEIYKIMRALADEGKVIIMISSELPEIMAVCDRIAVFCEGTINKILINDQLTEENIMAWALPC